MPTPYRPGATPHSRLNAAAKAISEAYRACLATTRNGASDSRSNRAAVIIRHHKILDYLGGSSRIRTSHGPRVSLSVTAVPVMTSWTGAGPMEAVDSGVVARPLGRVLLVR